MCIYGWKPLMMSHNIAIIDGNMFSSSGDMKFLISHVTSQNHVIEGSSKFPGSSSWYVTILPSQVVIGVVIVEI